MKTGIYIGTCAIALTTLVVIEAGCKTTPVTAGREIQTQHTKDLNIVLLNDDGELAMGKNRFIVAFRSAASNQPVDAGTVTVSSSMQMPGMTMAAPVELAPAGSKGQYVVTGDFAMAGAWKFQVTWNGPAGQGSTSFNTNVGSAPVQASSVPSQPDSASDPAIATNAVTVAPGDLDRLQLKFAKITEKNMDVEVTAPATVQPNTYKQIHVSPLVGGVVTQVAAELGQTVTRGQTLVRIFSQDLAEAQAMYISTAAEAEADHKKLVRTQELLAAGAASRRQLEEAEATHQAHEAHLEGARKKLLLLGLDSAQLADVEAGNQAETNISISSPLDGVVTVRNVNLGQVVTVAQDLLTVTDLSSVWIEANLFENDLGAVRIGTPATITSRAYAGRQFHGAVSYIDPQIDPTTRTARVRVPIDNPGLSLKLGMYMEAQFTSSGEGKVPVVPKSAVQTIGVTSVVFVPVNREPGHFLQQTVKTGEESVDGLRIVEGLKVGDTVVTDGSVLLRAEAIRQHP